MQVSRPDIDSIVQNVRGHHYQLACRKHFEVTHRNPHDMMKDGNGNDSGAAAGSGNGGPAIALLESVGNHPNAYFEASMAHYKEDSASSSNKKPSIDAGKTENNKVR